jgi:hypothetical protein
MGSSSSRPRPTPGQVSCVGRAARLRLSVRRGARCAVWRPLHSHEGRRTTRHMCAAHTTATAGPSADQRAVLWRGADAELLEPAGARCSGATPAAEIDQPHECPPPTTHAPLQHCRLSQVGAQQPGTQPPQQQQPAARPPPRRGSGGGSQPQEYQQTATVKNQVNLKKASLQLVPLEGRAHEFGLKFTFDATAPCRWKKSAVGRGARGVLLYSSRRGAVETVSPPTPAHPLYPHLCPPHPQTPPPKGSPPSCWRRRTRATAAAS